MAGQWSWVGVEPRRIGVTPFLEKQQQKEGPDIGVGPDWVTGVGEGEKAIGLMRF